MSVSTITVACTAGGTGASTGSFVGLYSSSGTRLVTSSDIGTVPVSISTHAISTQSLTAGTFVWVAIVVNLATTQPTLMRSAVPPGVIPNLNLSAATSRLGVAATAQTSLPSSFTPSALAVTNNAALFWFGLS